MLSWAAIAFSGCSWGPVGPHGPSANPATASSAPGASGAAPAAAGTQPSADAPEVDATLNYLVNLQMVSIEVPLGTASGSEEIWSYLDEEAASGPLAAGLGRNGFRVGLAKHTNWPELARIFKRLTGREMKETSLLARPSVPLPILLKSDQPVQTIFLFDQNRHLSGADYPPGDDLLTVVCGINQDDPNQLMVTGRPQIRTSYQAPRVGTGMLLITKPILYDLGPLTFRFSIVSEDLIVIGPGAESRRPSSAAHHFLINTREGMDFETVLVLIPKTVRVMARPAAGLKDSNKT